MLATPELLREATMPYKLGVLLPRWLAEVPLYRAVSNRAGHLGTAVSTEQLATLPLISKGDIRKDFPRNLLRAGEDLAGLLDDDIVEVEHTSGTSEERTSLLLGKGWWAEQEHRALRLHPMAAALLDEVPGARRVTVSSPVCSGDICYTGVPSRSERILENTLFLSLSRFPFLWGESDLARMAEETLEWQPRFLDVDPVYGVVFALYCERRQIRLPSIRFVVCSYEFLSITHRRILERVFGVPVLNLYGSTETGHLLMETSTGEMASSMETAFLEVLNPDQRGVGELVITTLTNDFMPLIRYRIGDLVEKREHPYCTRYVVHGRVMDSFKASGQRRVTPLQVDECFQGIEGVAHYQLSEREKADFLLRFLADKGSPSPHEMSALRSRLTQLFGEQVNVTLEQTDLVMPESSGKFRLCYPLPMKQNPAAQGQS